MSGLQIGQKEQEILNLAAQAEGQGTPVDWKSLCLKIAEHGISCQRALAEEIALLREAADCEGDIK